MRLFFYNTKYLVYKVLVLVFVSVLVQQNSLAQKPNPLPDSISESGDSLISPAPTTSIVDSSVMVGDSAINGYENDTTYGDPRSEKTNTETLDTISMRSVPNDLVARYKIDKDFAYANDPAYWKKESDPKNNESSFSRMLNNFFRSTAFKIFVYLLLAAVLLYALYRIIVDNKFYLFYSPKKAQEKQETETLDLPTENFDEKINQAMGVQDYRLAVRWMYLKSLQMLNGKGLIQYHADTTNHEYFLQLAEHEQKNNFRFLTNAYDYAWYGRFVISTAQAELIQQHFNQLYIAIK
ncbi:MAG: DUF4129 domain-containing protein [Bacteroidetes bacterium]|nr:DUF4129 domain-containing protein [Bacteroidota bacterium]